MKKIKILFLAIAFCLVLTVVITAICRRYICPEKDGAQNTSVPFRVTAAGDIEYEIKDFNEEGRHYIYAKYKKLQPEGIRVLSIKGEGEELVIPSEIQGMKVKEIGQSFENSSKGWEDMIAAHGGAWRLQGQDLKKIVVPEGVTKICEYAFFECHAGEMVLPETLKCIDSATFSYCKIKKIVVGSRDVKLCEMAFNGAKVKEVEFPVGFCGRIGDNCFIASTIETVRWPQEEKTDNKDKSCVQGKVENYAFCQCKKLKKVIFPENQKKIIIPDGCFVDCDSLEELVFPESTGSVKYGSMPYADNNKKGGADVLVFKGKNTRLRGQTTKAGKKILTVGKVRAPAGSKAIQFAKKAYRIKWINNKAFIKDAPGGVEEVYGEDEEYGDVTLAAMRYEET